MTGRRDASASSQSTRVATQNNHPHLLSRLLLREDYRARLPLNISRFFGFHPPDSKPPYAPLPFPPFSSLERIPFKVEVCIFGWIGSFVAIMLVEAISSTSTIFRNTYQCPLIITSFGAAAVLLYAAPHSPLSQPRNLILGNLAGAIIGVGLTRLFARDKAYEGHLDNTRFHPSTFLNGALTVSITILITALLGIVHPPAGATALAAATEDKIVEMSWKYIPVVLASSLLFLAWALIINNLGRQRYPLHWWSPQRCFVVQDAREGRQDAEMGARKLEEGNHRR